MLSNVPKYKNKLFSNIFETQKPKQVLETKLNDHLPNDALIVQFPSINMLKNSLTSEFNDTETKNEFSEMLNKAVKNSVRKWSFRENKFLSKIINPFVKKIQTQNSLISSIKMESPDFEKQLLSKVYIEHKDYFKDSSTNRSFNVNNIYKPQSLSCNFDALKNAKLNRKYIDRRFSNNFKFETDPKETHQSQISKLKFCYSDKNSKKWNFSIEKPHHIHRCNLIANFESNSQLPFQKSNDECQFTETIQNNSLDFLKSFLDRSLYSITSNEDQMPQSPQNNGTNSFFRKMPLEDKFDDNSCQKINSNFLNLEIELPDQKKIILNICSVEEIAEKVNLLAKRHNLNEEAKQYILCLVNNEVNHCHKNEYGY